MPTTRSKKELQEENENLKKELYLYKNKYQLSRNYDIVKEENKKLKEEINTLKEAKTC
tara:strand:- start:580 stop:753 length:174 start_codon:yes stop_codon:yes gene_type:complete